MNDEGEIDVETGSTLGAGYTGPGALEGHGPDVAPLEQIALHPQNEVVGLIAAAGARVQKPERPRPRLS